MPAGEMDEVVDRLRDVALRREAPGDGELLEAFVARRDGRAFETLVRRHAAMVLGVCRRVVGHGPDAEDAFQATFLVLVRKAGSVVPRELVGNWLYGVAYRTALKARALAGRRRLRERRMTDMPEPSSDDRIELLRLLDRELDRLPAKYRTPIILCDLEGRTRREAARQLGVPTGTLSGRLTTAHRLLAKRLARHGLAVTGTSLSAALAGQASAGAPAGIVSSTIKAAALFGAGSAAAAGLVPHQAAVLAEGVLKTMLLTKLKLASAVLASVIILGAGVLAYDGPGPAPGQSPREAPAKPASKPAATAEARAQAELDSARVLVEVAAAKVNAAEADLKVAHQQLERAQADYERAKIRAKESEKPATDLNKPKPDGAVLKYGGTLRPASVVQITAGVAGKVTQVHVQEGDAVKAGQVLATLDTAAFRGELERAEVNLELAKAKLQEARAAQWAEKMNPGTAAGKVAVAEAEVKRAELDVAQAKGQLSKSQLTAPIAGVVVKRQVEVGDTVNPAAATPAATRLFEIIDPRNLVVAVTVVERDLSAVSVGQRVRVDSHALPGTTLEGLVARIAPTIDPRTGAAAVQVALKIPAGDVRWKPGMSVGVAFLPKE